MNEIRDDRPLHLRGTAGDDYKECKRLKIPYIKVENFKTYYFIEYDLMPVEWDLSIIGQEQILLLIDDSISNYEAKYPNTKFPEAISYGIGKTSGSIPLVIEENKKRTIEKICHILNLYRQPIDIHNEIDVLNTFLQTKEDLV